MRCPLAFSIPFLVLLSACATTADRIPRAWMSVPEAPRIRAVQLGADGKVTHRATSQTNAAGDVRIASTGAGQRLMRGTTALTDSFLAIDSFDVSESRGEVVFSAKRADNFDIGLVAVDGSQVNWAPAEPVDEVSVQWAPRGNKVSYVVRGRSGDLIRTLHIPTSFQLAADFPPAKIHALGWDPPAEKFAVSYSTPDASDRVEVMAYRGAERKMAIEPAVRLAVDVEPFAPDAIVLRPRDVRYGEKLPLVVWIDDEPFAWNDARAELIRTARVACVVTGRTPSDALWRVARETAWVDASRVFIVAPRAVDAPNALVITGDAAVPAGRYRRYGGVVAVPPAVVQSFAARFIADQLKGTTRPNGSSQ